MAENFKQIVQEIFRKKVERRQGLAKLPLEKKVRILIKLQKIASEIRKMSGRTGPEPWRIT